MALTRLSLSNFRNHADIVLSPRRRFIMLHGPNGAGKTNILEAVSLLVPGRGLRRAALSEMIKRDGPGGFTVSADINGSHLGTGVDADAPERRKVRINGASQPANALAEWLSVIWLTPAMDRLFAEAASGRRRFLDRLVLALEPGHAAHTSRYDSAMRQRNRLLSGDAPVDPAWFDALEREMAKSAAPIISARTRMLTLLRERIAMAAGEIFAAPDLALDQTAEPDEEALLVIWAEHRSRDRAAGRTLDGPHRVDLIAQHRGHGQPASSCSTGEQKAMLLSIILAHAAIVAEARGEAPILLLDEVAAHLDPSRRSALFERLGALGGQVWMTGTEPGLFDGIGDIGDLVGFGS
jgi:DNA replication and repair protein RecF